LSRVFAVTRTDGAEGADARIHVAVWTSDQDRTLLAAESFGSVADMESWIRGRASSPDEELTLVWTDDLRRDPALAHSVASALGVPLPRRRRRRPVDADRRTG
jgi:hypothetical protein